MTNAPNQTWHQRSTLNADQESALRKRKGLAENAIL